MSPIPEDLLAKHAGFFSSLAGRIAPGITGAAAKAAPALEQKVAPVLKNTFGNIAKSVGRGLFGVGAREGATNTMRAANGVTRAGMAVAPIAGTAFAMSQARQPQPGMNVYAAYAAGAEFAAAKLAGLNLQGLAPRLKSLAPHADHLLELGGLGVLAGAPLYDMAAPESFKQNHPHVGHALDLAGLGILTVPALKGLAAHKPAPGLPA